ncbi:Putative DNA-binding protein YwzG [Candidatus Hydrogenisulfobacillus filiaventi]|uniref:DNA-binding protein YwzG n=1 Tax=Candidatus Hydrogenisulfobacillus filiaventi TaxID=2707344 RepID=A0A6F8ZIK2_9FIRM|nr:Putative DNA-binding protein YwzG [Candidatus Hydrogenisulfobacillus filiaventi]
MDALVPSVPTLLVLRALEEEPRHGYGIARWVEGRSGGELSFKEGTLYPVLHQLERQGLVAGRWTTSPGGRRVREYALTDNGRRALEQERELWLRRSRAVDRCLVPGEVPAGGLV